MCVGERSGSNPEPGDTEPSALPTALVALCISKKLKKRVEPPRQRDKKCGSLDRPVWRKRGALSRKREICGENKGKSAEKTPCVAKSAVSVAKIKKIVARPNRQVGPRVALGVQPGPLVGCGQASGRVPL